MASGLREGSAFLLGLEGGFATDGSFFGLGGFSFLAFGFFVRLGKGACGAATDGVMVDGKSVDGWFGIGSDLSSILI